MAGGRVGRARGAAGGYLSHLVFPLLAHLLQPAQHAPEVHDAVLQAQPLVVLSVRRHQQLPHLFPIHLCLLRGRRLRPGEQQACRSEAREPQELGPRGDMGSFPLQRGKGQSLRCGTDPVGTGGPRNGQGRPSPYGMSFPRESLLLTTCTVHFWARCLLGELFCCFNNTFLKSLFQWSAPFH